MNRSGKINVMAIILTVVLSYGGVVGVRYWKTYWSNLAVKEAIRRTAFEWRDVNQLSAESYLNSELRRLDFELDEMCKSKGDYGCCRLYEESLERHIYCWWWDYFKYPLVDKYKSIYYEVHKVLGVDNQVYDGEVG
jgi:hypothetical protein